jgi:hypothetical protein
VCGASPTSNDFQAEKSFHIDEGLFAEYLTRVTHRGEDNAAWRLRYRFAVEVSPRRVSQVNYRPVERGQESEVSEPESDNTKDLLHVLSRHRGVVVAVPFDVEVTPRCVSQVADWPVQRVQEREVSEAESDNKKDLLHTSMTSGVSIPGNVFHLLFRVDLLFSKVYCGFRRF